MFLYEVFLEMMQNNVEEICHDFRLFIYLMTRKYNFFP